MNLPEAIEILTAAGTDRPRFEAQLLLAQALGVERVAVVAGTYAPPEAAQQAEFDRLVCERAKRVPLAYLRGTQAFYGLEFEVSSAVLVPRPETEHLVEEALALIRHSHRAEPFSIADVGTGSGCIPVSIVKAQANIHAVAFDLSPDALAVARRNAVRHEVTKNIRFVRSNLLYGVAAEIFDLIVSNPPYISSANIAVLQPEVRDYEPRLALDGGRDGLEVYRLLAPQAIRALKPDGWLVLEVGQGQADTVRQILSAAGFVAIQTQCDLAGIERVVRGRKRNLHEHD